MGIDSVQAADLTSSHKALTLSEKALAVTNEAPVRQTLQGDLNHQQLLPSFQPCYFCGTGNRSGLSIRYTYQPERERVAGNVKPPDHLCGFPHILHGGIQAALLDDVMYWAVAHRTATGSATAELTCRYLRAATLGQTFLLTASVESQDGRKVHTRGQITDSNHHVVAEAVALYVLFSRQRFEAEILPHYDFTGCSTEIVQRFRDGTSVK